MESSGSAGAQAALARHALRELLDTVSLPGGDVAFVESGKVLRTRYPAEALGAASFAAVGLGVAQIWRQRTGRTQQVRIDMTPAALALRASRYLRIDGRDPGPDFKDPYTGYYPARDGRYMFLHNNFPAARAANLAVLGAAPDVADIARQVAGWQAEALEEAVFAAGGCGAMVRTPEEWAASPQALAVAREPLLRIERIGNGPAVPLPQAARPLGGLRVLDLTRVIAGPSCCRVFAEHGAEVLKITRADLPGSGVLDIETGIGKQSARLDLREPAQAETLRGLAEKADVFVQSYRPGTLDARGFSPADLAALRPGIVHVSLNAWGETGPWRARRGYDTAVQAACGMAWTQRDGTGKPAQQPVSALDYLAGNLMAFGAMQALSRRALQGGSWRVHVSLARMARWLADAGLCDAEGFAQVPADLPADTIEGLCRRIASPLGEVRYMAPVVGLSETAPALLAPPLPLGASPARWALPTARFA